jgi:hypothetical protein
MVSDPGAAYADLLGYVPPSPAPASIATSRADLLRSMRPSVLDLVGSE